MFYLWDNFEVHNLKFCLNFSDMVLAEFENETTKQFQCKRYIPTIIRNSVLIVSFLHMLIIQHNFSQEKRYLLFLPDFLYHIKLSFFLSNLEN